MRGKRKDDYIPCKMTTNNNEWDQGWFYLRNDDGRLPAYSGKVLLEKPDAWSYGVLPAERYARLEMYTDALQRLAGKGLTAAIVIANFHRRRVLPLTERKLPLFQMTGDARTKAPGWWRSSCPTVCPLSERGGRCPSPCATLRTIGGSRCAPRRGTFKW